MSYQSIDGKVVNDAGMIAVEHQDSNPANITVGGTTYVFLPRHNVSLAWVYPEHLDKLLAVKKRDTGCNCGNRVKFHLANLNNTNIYETGTRDGLT